MKILLLSGGSSPEREISQRSGDNVAAALSAAGYSVLRADPASPGFDLAAAARGVDLVFPILHGAGGEDGVLQAHLEQLGVQFLGAGSVASRLAFDKIAFIERMKEGGVRVPRGEAVTAETLGRSELVARPFVLKPVDGGSSIDTFMVRDAQRVPDFGAVFARHGQMLLEELVEGQEVTVGVVGSEALPVILITPPDGEEFDYANKYNGKTREVVAPPHLSEAVQAQARELAVRVHQLVGCRHLSRTDMIVTAAGELCVLELNTIPGLTTESLVPKAAAAAGLDMPALVRRLVELAAHDAGHAA